MEADRKQYGLKPKTLTDKPRKAKRREEEGKDDRKEKA